MCAPPTFTRFEHFGLKMLAHETPELEVAELEEIDTILRNDFGKNVDATQW